MKYTDMFSESLRNTAACRSDKYGRKGALQQLEVYGGSRTTSHHMLTSQPREDKRIAFGEAQPYSKDDSARVQRHLGDRERRASVYDGTRLTDNYSKYAKEPYVPTPTTMPLSDIDNKGRLYRGSAIGGGRDKYNRTFESKYAQEYEGKGVRAFQPKEGVGCGEKVKLVSAYEPKRSSAYEPRNHGHPDYSKQNYELYKFQAANMERGQRGERSYDHQGAGYREPGRLHNNFTASHQTTATYEAGTGKDLLKNLDKVQQKIRNLLNQKN